MSEIIGPFEYQILTVLLQQPHDAYGVMILQRIMQRTGGDPSVGALYTTLDRLERKGFVKSSWGEPTAVRGGRRKRYFEIKAPGLLALRRAEAMMAGLRQSPAEGALPA